MPQSHFFLPSTFLLCTLESRHFGHLSQPSHKQSWTATSSTISQATVNNHCHHFGSGKTTKSSLNSATCLSWQHNNLRNSLFTTEGKREPSQLSRRPMHHHPILLRPMPVRHLPSHQSQEWHPRPLRSRTSHAGEMFEFQDPRICFIKPQAGSPHCVRRGYLLRDAPRWPTIQGRSTLRALALRHNFHNQNLMAQKLDPSFLLFIPPFLHLQTLSRSNPKFPGTSRIHSTIFPHLLPSQPRVTSPSGSPTRIQSIRLCLSILIIFRFFA